MTMGQRLLALRTQAGLSQEALAERLGVSRQSISKWETDASIPDLDKLVRLGEIFGVTLDELVKGTTDDKAQDAQVIQDPGGAGPTEAAGTPSAAATEEVLRLHRQKLLGILLIVVSLAVTLLNFALFFVTLPVFAAGMLCLLVRRRLGLAIGWTLWISALVVTRYGSAVSMGQLLNPEYWQHMTPIVPLLALAQLAALVLLAWQTLRNPPALKACWAIWLGLLAALWLPALRLLYVPVSSPLSAPEVLVNFLPLLSPDYYKNAPLGAALWWCHLLALVWLVRHSWQSRRNAARTSA